MNVKKITVREQSVTTYIIPDNIEINYSDWDHIKEQVQRITDNPELLKVGEQKSQDIAVDTEDATGHMIEKIQNHYDHLKA